MPSALSSGSNVAPTARPWGWIISGLVFAGLLTVYPPFRVVSQKTAIASAATAAAGSFDPAAFVAKFWSEQLQPAATRAPALSTLLADLQHDPSAAVQLHGHRVGLGNAVYFFARGTGRITAVERSRLLVEIDGTLVALRTGPVFGNVVRDGSGLLELNQAPGLSEFNAISAELNRLIEAEVQPPLKAAATVGATLTFSGCAEAPEALPGAGSPLLTFIPLQAEVTP